ncbi:hypothetical protein BpHYR1_049546 [Brachionus plicatilis]|uniref:Uncharacterized protein n=1 Tax=Brachionus plicatilis TaxID=10195 RepID=A0A3M7SBC0_BRAPC|nr:hypothetical protein BpHYR1_049546 [Brachionus plicatilis]
MKLCENKIFICEIQKNILTSCGDSQSSNVVLQAFFNFFDPDPYFRLKNTNIKNKQFTIQYFGSHLFYDQLVTNFVTKLVGTGLVTTLVIKVYDL